MATQSTSNNNGKQSRERTPSSPITAPDRRKYEAEVHKISELIKEKEKQIGLVAADGHNHGDDLNHLSIELEVLEEKKKNTFQDIRNIEEQLQKLGKEIAKHKNESNRLLVGLKYMTEEKYENQIKKVELEVESGRYGLKDQRTLENELESLKNGKAKVSHYQAARHAVDSCRNEQDRLRKQKDSLHHQLKATREKISSKKDKMSLCRQDLDRVREKQREKKSQRETISKEIRDLHTQRRELHDRFRQHQLQYMDAMKASSSSQETTSTDQQRAHKTNHQDNHHKTLREFKAKSHTTNLSDQSFEEERTMCRTLLSFFSRMLESGRTGEESLFLTPSPNGLSSSDTSPVSPSRRSHVASSDSTTSYEVLPSKKETIDKEWLPSSANTKRRDSMRKDRKKSRKEKRSHQKPLQLNPTMFAQFSKLGLRPPATMAEVSPIVQELKQKMIVYDSNGSESEAGDSGIMSSTGISEYGLTSGEVTPNRITGNESSPQPFDHMVDGGEICLHLTPMNSIKGSEHTNLIKLVDGNGSMCSESSDVSSTPTVQSDQV